MYQEIIKDKKNEFILYEGERNTKRKKKNEETNSNFKSMNIINHESAGN